MAARSVQVLVQNDTQFNLLLDSVTLMHGEWTDPFQPPGTIGNEGEIRSESNGIGTGTEAQVVYLIMDLDNQLQGRLRMHWDNPFVGSNSYEAEATPPGQDDGSGFTASFMGGHGNNATVTFTLVRGHCDIDPETGELICMQSQELQEPIEPNGVQDNWRFCVKCNEMFFDGSGNKGACPRGGGHAAAGLNFTLPHGSSGQGQADWRFCTKCFAIFWNGDPNNKGACPAGGGHHAQGFHFILPHDVGGPGQNQWRFCNKCFAMFFNGDPNNKGACPRGGGHFAQGFDFRLNGR